MPQNILSQPRTWGTRFDSFISSEASPTLPQPTETNNTPDVAAAEHVPDDPPKPTDQRMPHDASIFVGSLPTNIDHAELSRLLSEHLVEHAEVTCVKVIRDSKGGVCAFVQCEDAPSAARLVHTLNTTPVQPFLGRYLRYEPARAFRTLLVSYRTPMGYADAEVSSDDLSPEKKRVELTLPTVMKLWRNRNSKYLSILYDNEAITSESSLDEYAASRGCGLYLSPLLFDEETIHKIALTFGHVEHFASYGTDTSPIEIPSKEDNEDTPTAAKLDKIKSFPFPHDGPRTATMNDGCWQIKWGHRDDAVSALITLRRVPHLTVTWANQPNYLSFEHRPSSQASHFPHLSGLPHAIRTPPHSSPLRIVGGPSFTDGAVSPSSSLVFPLPSGPEKKKLTIQTYSNNNRASDVFSSNAASSPVYNKWNIVQASEGVTPLSPSPSSNIPSVLPSHQQKSQVSPIQKKLELSEKDFPPLGPVKAEHKAGSGSWGDRKQPKNDSEDVNGPSSTGMTSPQLSIPAIPRAPAPEIPISQDGPGVVQALSEEDGEELDMPPTPDFGMSPNTPKTTGSMMFPHTPSAYNFGVHSPSSKSSGAKVSTSYLRDEGRGDSIIDPTSIFVGGLEMNAWDEERVKGFFSKFGRVEDVKVVFPTSGRSAFAFVKFDNTEAPARAVFQEHNRLHDGRPMRVQLRDHNPPRGMTWRYGRGRGKYPYPSVPRHYVDSSGIVSQETSLEKNEKGYLQEQNLEADPVNDGDALHTAVTYPTLLENSNEGVDGPANNFSHFGCTDPVARVGTPDPTSVEYPRSGHTSPQCAYPKDASSRYVGQGWNRDTEASAPLTPAPSSYASSVSTVPSMPYPTPNMGYYQPQPWMPPFGQQFPFAIPFTTGYPGYPLPSQQLSQSFASPSGSESSKQSTGPHAPWVPSGGIYPPFVPYSNYTLPQQQQQPSPQTPLVPTGFVQGEQGTLIPVYQPEARDQYMTSGTHQPSAPQSQAQFQNWAHYPQAPPFPFFPVPQIAAQPPGHAGNVSWIPNQPPIVFSTGQQSGGTAFRGGHRQSGHHHAPSRRHRQSTNDRNLPTRSPHGRHAVGATNNAEQTFNGHSMPDHGRSNNSYAPQAAFNGTAGPSGWNPWSGSR